MVIAHSGAWRHQEIERQATDRAATVKSSDAEYGRQDFEDRFPFEWLAEALGAAARRLRGPRVLLSTA